MIITPMRPIAVAIQRRMPTFSLRKMIESAVTNSGETKPVAEASAMGRKLKPVMKNSEEPSSAVPRISWRPRRSVRIACNGEPGSITGVNISAKVAMRIQVISIDGRLDDRYFEVTSEQPRKIVDSNTNAIPLKG